MPDLDDAALELRLRRVLADRLDPLPFAVSAHELEHRRLVRDRTRRRHQVLVGLGLAAALVVPVGWLVAGAPIPTVPLPAVIIATPGPTDHPAPTSTAAVVTMGDGPYQAIVMRAGNGSGFDVIAIRADGQERVLAQLTSAAMPTGFSPEDAYVGGNGWLAILDSNPMRLVLVDLRHPGAPTRIVNGAFAPVAWGPDGRLAISDEEGKEPGQEPSVIFVVDPATDELIGLPRANPRLGRPFAWAADGSGLVAVTGDWPPPMPGHPVDWQRQLVPSGALVPGFVPVHDDGHVRRQSIAGDRLVLCTPRSRSTPCPESPGFSVGRLDVAGDFILRDVTPPSGGVDAATFAATDRGVWILRRDPDAGRFGLDRRDDQGVVVRSVTSPLPAGLMPAANSRPVDWRSDTRLEAMSPDNSLARIVMRNDDPDITEWFLLPTDGLPGTYHQEGVFAGYLASSIADSIGTDGFRPVPGADRPEVGHAPDLPSDEQMDSYAAKSWSASAADAVLRASWSQGQEPTEIGAVRQPAGHRLAVQFACSGPGGSSMTVRDADLTGGDITIGAACMLDDQSASGVDIEAASTDRLLPIVVAVGERPSWRLVVYDLGP